MFGVIQWYTDRGLLPGPCHFQYVLGVQGGLPAVPKSVFELEEYRKEMFPDSTWSAFGTSKGNLPCIFTALALGGGIRVGLGGYRVLCQRDFGGQRDAGAARSPHRERIRL